MASRRSVPGVSIGSSYQAVRAHQADHLRGRPLFTTDYIFAARWVWFLEDGPQPALYLLLPICFVLASSPEFCSSSSSDERLVQRSKRDASSDTNGHDSGCNDNAPRHFGRQSERDTQEKERDAVALPLATVPEFYTPVVHSSARYDASVDSVHLPCGCSSSIGKEDFLCLKASILFRCVVAKISICDICGLTEVTKCA